MTKKENFGTLADGTQVTQYTLSNSAGVELQVLDYGATITSLLLPNGDGTKDNIVCGFNNLSGYFSDDYKANAPYFGCTVGRYCSTIKDARYADVSLTVNCAEHNLHGGTVGFDKRMWTVEDCCVSGASICFTLTSEDGDQGFPGEVVAKVCFTLSEDNALSIKYEATTNKRTPFTMTNHSYFNLSGFKQSIEGHTVTINSQTKIPLNFEGTFAEAQQSVAGKADDLRESKCVADVHAAMGDGFEHYYLFDDGVTDSPRKVGSVQYEEREMEVWTSEPGMLFYTGKYTSDALQRESGEKFGKFRGLCFESHRVPNGPNIEGAPNVFLEAEEKYNSETIFKFKL